MPRLIDRRIRWSTVSSISVDPKIAVVSTIAAVDRL